MVIFVNMPLAITAHILEKLEQLLIAMGYKVRYEKGSFKTGSCVLEYSKIVVVNKFSSLEVKIFALVSLIKHIEFNEVDLPEKQKQFYFSLIQTELF